MIETLREIEDEFHRRNRMMWIISLKLEKLSFKLPIWAFPFWLIKLHSRWVSWNWKPMLGIYGLLKDDRKWSASLCPICGCINSFHDDLDVSEITIDEEEYDLNIPLNPIKEYDIELEITSIEKGKVNIETDDLDL